MFGEMPTHLAIHADVARLPFDKAVHIAVIHRDLRVLSERLPLRGRYYWFGNRGKEAAEYFRKAIALQPDFALGWVGLSDYYGAAAVSGDLPPAEANPKAEFAAKRALQLNDSLDGSGVTVRIGYKVFRRCYQA
jgi:hypothetical protein